MKRVMAWAVVAVLATSGLAWAADEGKTASEVENKGISYLLSRQGKDFKGEAYTGVKAGAWIPESGPAVTALVVKGLLQAGKGVDDPAVKKALEFIETFKRDDGGYYGDSNVTYSAAIVLSAFGALPEKTKAEYKGRIEGLQKFLEGIQSVEGTKDDKGTEVTKDHPWYGGWGYGTGAHAKPGKRPDLSNTHFVIEALRETGVPASDPAIQKAMVFVSRLQANSETNNQPWVKGQTDGGFIYSMRWNDKLNTYGESFAGTHKDRDGNEVLSTYGSMTYAGLKSFLYADLKKDDPRVKAAMRWVTNNWTLEKNPGMGNNEGQFYYYLTFAKALKAYGEPTVTDERGIKHDWKADYIQKMKDLQKPDGSFVNPTDRWMEGDPAIPTSYVVLGLEEIRK